VTLRKGRCCLALVLALGLALGLGHAWLTEPLDRSPLLGTELARETEALLAAEATEREARPVEAGALRVGWSSASITPPLGTPTLGYGARFGRGVTAIEDEVYARALAVAAGEGPPLVFLTADLCLWTGELSGQVAGAVADALPRARIYFGATHTHSGPGAYARGGIEYVMGAYDPAIVDLIVSACASAIREAVAELGPGSMRELSVAAPEFVKNRMRKGDPLDDELVLVEYRKADGRRCAWVSYAAHATAVGHAAIVCSGDYPGALVRGLLEGGYDAALFFAAETGQAGPAQDGKGVYESEVAGAWALGEAIAQRLLALSAGAREPFLDEVRSSVFRAPVRLPAWRYPFLGRALDPAIVSWILGGAQPSAWVHALRLGDSVYLGHAFEFSAVIGRRLKERARERGGRLVLTSFNGDHGFYVIPEDYYDDGRYEAGSTVFGPGLGPYMERISEQVFDHMHAGATDFELGAE
jgi:hypothetical protein